MARHPLEFTSRPAAGGQPGEEAQVAAPAPFQNIDEWLEALSARLYNAAILIQALSCFDTTSSEAVATQSAILNALEDIQRMRRI